MKKRTKAKQSKITPKAFVKREWMNIGLIGAVLIISVIMIGPKTVMADGVVHPTPAEQKATDLMIAAMHNVVADFGTLPESDDRPATRTMTLLATAYNSEVGQTDSTPFITASGTTVRHGVVAANFLPIGTKIKIPEYYGDQIFVVEDRMNARYDKRLDIWMESKEEAKQFGVRTIEIEIYR